jgi:hypothetical protein
VRGFAIVAPLAASFAFVRFASELWRPPTSSLPLFLAGWFALSAAATLVLLGVDRLARRLLPLAALLRLSLVFPDETPSRFRTAMRSGGVETLEKRLRLVDAAKAARTPRDAAARLLELIAALNMHDKLTRGHSERVRAYSVLIGKELGLHDDELDLLNWAALLHDVGKLEVSQGILTKPGKPSEEEWQVLRRHPLFGEELTAALEEWLERWYGAVGYHHERWDGKGYPRGLAGDEIPLAGRIVAVADVFDVITSARSYKLAGSTGQARREIARCAGTQFDPEVVRAFLNVSHGRTGLIMGPLSWLSHAPMLGRLPLTPALGTLAGAASVVAATAATGTLAHPHLRPQRSAVEAAPAHHVAHAAPAPASAAARVRGHAVRLAGTRAAPARELRISTPARAPAARTSASASPVATAAAGSAAVATAVVLPEPHAAPAPAEASSPAEVPPVDSAPAADPVAADTPAEDAPPADAPEAEPEKPEPSAAGPVTLVQPAAAAPAAEPPAPPVAETAPAEPADLPAADPSAPVASQLAFTTEPPASVAAGAAFTVAVAIEGAAGNVIATDGSTTVTIALQSPAGATLTCAPPGRSGPVAVVAGVASFSCSLDRSGSGYALVATSAPTLAGATSTALAVTPGPAARLAFTTEPAGTTAGSPLATTVAVEDALGNVVVGDDSTSVTIALGSNPGSATLGGMLTQTVRGGVAAFTSLSVGAPGTGYTLGATSAPANWGATSGAFDVGAASGVTAAVLASNSGAPCTSGSTCTTASFTAAAGSTLLVVVERAWSTTTNDAVSSVTGPLTSAAPIASFAYAAGTSNSYLFAWTATATGSPGSVTVNVAGGDASPTVVDVIQLSGADPASPIADTTTEYSVGATAVADLDSPAAGDAEVVVASFLTNASLAAPAGFAALEAFATGANGGDDLGIFFDSAAQPAVSVRSPGSGSSWGTIAIEIAHA